MLSISRLDPCKCIETVNGGMAVTGSAISEGQVGECSEAEARCLCTMRVGRWHTVGGIQPGKTRPWFTSADAGVMGKAEGPEIRCSYQCLDPLVFIFIEGRSHM